MSTKNTVIMLTATVLLTLTMWMMPQTLTAETQTKRLLQITTYNTNPNRLQSVQNFCAGVSRDNLIDAGQISTSQSYKDQMAAQFTINGNNLINLFAAGNTDAGVKMAQQDSTSMGLFAGAFVVGLVILLFIWSFLLCCCCCPSCCPSKCCQKSDNQQYSKCQLYWPSILLILCLLLIIVTCALGLINAAGFKEGIDDVSCASARMLDDLINGNVTSNGNNFFMGISTLASQVVNLNNNLTNIQNNISQLAGVAVSDAASNASQAVSNVQLVPNNINADGNASIQYTIAFNQSYNGANPTIDSVLVGVLGSSGNGGLIGTLYATLLTVNDTLYSIESSSTNFGSTSGNFSGTVSGITSAVNDLQTQINDIDNSFNDIFTQTQKPKQMATLGVQLFYGINLGMAVLALIGVLLMTFCDKYKCRYLMYFACVIMFFFGLIGFMLATLFSFILPFMYWGCDWMTITFSSPTSFNTNMADIITDSTIRGYISPCLPPGGNGDIVTAIDSTAAGILDDLKTSIRNATNFNTSSQVGNLAASLTQLDIVVGDFYNGNTPDITNTAAIATLVYVTDYNNFDATCTVLSTDSWVVSLGNTSYTSCAITGSNTDFASGCNTRALVTSNNAACQGCIDSTDIFNNLYNPNSNGSVSRGDLASDLVLKYNSAVDTQCASFVTYYGNIWDNYYFVKIPAVDSINSRWTTASASISNANTAIGAINTTIQNVIGNLTATVDSVIDPNYGLIAGLNCLLIGQDINTFIDSICVSNFNTIYLNRLILGISAFGILFSLCCIVCSGVRHFKHSERKEKIVPDMFGKNSFQDTNTAFKP